MIVMMRQRAGVMGGYGIDFLLALFFHGSLLYLSVENA